MSTKTTYGFIIVMLLAFASPLAAQHNKVLKFTRAGNKDYKESNFKEAEVNFRKALDLDQNHFTAQYNLANNLYKQKRYKEAAEQYQEIRDLAPNDEVKAHILHNLGNSYFQEKQYEKSVAAYKNALKINPDDEDTRYNYSYAQSMLKKQHLFLFHLLLV